MFTVKTSFQSDLAARLTQLPTAVSVKAQTKALVAGGRVIQKEAARRAPRDEQAGPPHLADSIVVSPRTETQIERAGDVSGTEEAIVDVGPTRQHFYGYFSEYGTAHEPARPWFRPAFDTRVGVAINVVLASLWESVRSTLGVGGGPSTTGRNV